MIKTAACGARGKLSFDDQFYACPDCIKALAPSKKNGMSRAYHGLYLVGLDSSGVIRAIDGYHTKPSEVLKAYKIHQGLGFVENGLTYKMAILKKDVATHVTWKFGEYQGQILNTANGLGLLVIKDIETNHKVKVNKEMIGIMSNVIKKAKKAA
jgi:hypothetical protein